MNAEPNKQSRGLFARKRDDLDAGPSELEARVQLAEGRAEAAETRVGDFQSELMFYGDAIRSLKSELEAVTERVVTRVAPQVVELEARSAETDALRRAVAAMEADAQTEREHLFQWRTEMEALVTSLHGDIETARRHIDRMPEMIRDALTPAAEAMANVGSGMSRLTALAVPSTALATPQASETAQLAEFGGEPAEPAGYDLGETQQEEWREGPNTGQAYTSFNHDLDDAAATMESLAWE